MKHYILILALLLSTVSSYAAKLVVEAGGSGGAYTTIQAAIDASVPGDQIYVYPGYYGTFSINTGGISILAALAGERYTLTSTYFINSITAPVHISNAEISDASFTTAFAGPTSPQAVYFTDCKIMGYANISLSVYENFIVYARADTFEGTSRISLAHGEVSGCYFKDNSSLGVYEVSNGTTLTGDIVKIIGNKFVDRSSVSTSTSPNLTHALLYVEGNYFNNPTTTSVYLFSSYFNATAVNTFVNNTFVCTTSAVYNESLGIAYTTGNMSKTNILNNVFISAAGHHSIRNSQNQGLPPGSLIDYNIFSESSTSSFNGGVVATGTNNIYSTTAAINSSTGAVTSGPGIDAGHPNPIYYDLDKTRNDMGCYGGSYSRANFDNTDNGSRVLMLKAPRVILSGNSATIQADGLAK